MGVAIAVLFGFLVLLWVVSTAIKTKHRGDKHLGE